MLTDKEQQISLPPKSSLTVFGVSLGICTHNAVPSESISLDGELLAPGQIDELAFNASVLKKTLEWVREYLGKGHPQLGRSGPVCPFTGEAVTRQALKIRLVRLKNDKRDRIEAVLLENKAAFMHLAQNSPNKMLTAIMMVFPDVALEEAPEVIDQIQKKYKPAFVAEGLMLGEFHLLNEAHGLHNSEFRPLRSPFPMLVIRHMVPSDIVFLNRNTDSAEVRIHFLEAYLRSLTNLRPNDLLTAEKSLEEARKELAARTLEEPQQCHA
jgi:hypothetical protein